MFDSVYSIEAFAAGLVGRPLAMTPDAAVFACDALSNLSATGVPARADAAAAPPYELSGGIATIRLWGQIVRRESWLAAALGLPSYEGLVAVLRAAEADVRVRGIVLDIDSPGGDVAGATEAAAVVRAVAATKPIVTFVGALAGSAACVIAAAANSVTVAPSATIGSLGVVYLHLDRSVANAKRGVKATVLHAGAFKADGHTYAALEDGARKRIQGLVDASHDLLVESVGRHRPHLGARGARATEAGLFMGQKAVAAGLADAVGTMETARARLMPSIVGPSPSPVAGGAAQTSTSGSIAMSSPVFRGAAAPIITPAPYPYSALAVLRASKKAQRVARANDLVARQLGGQSTDDSWGDARAWSQGHGPRPALPAAPDKSAAGNVDDAWREVIDAMSSHSSAFGSVYR